MSEKQIIQTPSLFEVDESFDDPRFMRVRINAMTTGINRNNSRFSLDCVKKAKDTFANIPVLAHVIEKTDEEGNKHLDYGSHDFHIENDAFNEDTQRIIYEEQVVGIVPESNDFEIVKNKETGEYNVFVTALLYRDYGNYVCDILESRNNTTDVSMEIMCDNISYSSKDKVMDVGEMMACGVTLLGSDVTPGMQGAKAEVFAIDDNNRQNQMIKIMQELKESLDNYMAIKANYNRGKEENQMEFEEKAEVTEALTDEVETVAEEFTEADNSEKIIEESATEESTEEEVAVTEAESEDTEEVTPPDENFEVDETEKIEEESVEEKTEEVETDQSNLQMAVTVAGETKNFALSLNQKILDLTTLVNEVYGENDNTYYSCDVFEDGQKYVIMHDFWNDRHYKQEFSYSNKKSAYTLKGDRTSVFAQYLTDVEIQQLENMRANYSVIETELAQYKAEPEKMAVLESDDYKNLAGNETFEALKAQDAHFEMSVDDLKAQCDAMLLEYAKGHKVEFETVEELEVKKPISFKRVIPGSPMKKAGKYGGIFSRS